MRNFDNSSDEKEMMNALLQLGVDQDEVDETEITDQEDTQEIEVESEKPKGSRQLTKEEQKIVALKKELQEQKKLMAEIQQERKQSDLANQKATIASGYKSKGYDDETAEMYAENEFKLKSLEEKLSLQEFKDDNYEVLSMYPQARKDLKWAMEAQKSTGLTVEQLLRGKYGDALPEDERRARDSYNSGSDYSESIVSNAVRSATRPTQSNLTTRELQQKSQLEDMIGAKMTIKEFNDQKSKFGF